MGRRSTPGGYGRMADESQHLGQTTTQVDEQNEEIAMNREPATTYPAPASSYARLTNISRTAAWAVSLVIALSLAALPAFGSDQAGAFVEPDYGRAALGKHLFRSFCASCHGVGGKGDGSLADVMTVEPSDLTALTKNNDGVFPYDRTFAVIDGREKVKGHGSSDMPAWGDAFSAISTDEEAVAAKIEQLVHFVWKLQAE